jgi:hypothetical protein
MVTPVDFLLILPMKDLIKIQGFTELSWHMIDEESSDLRKAPEMRDRSRE